MKKETKINRVSEVTKYAENPFLGHDSFKIKKGKQSIRVGTTNKLLVDPNTGEAESIGVIYKDSEVDKEEFVKVYIKGVKDLLDLSNTGTKAFYFVIQCLRINEATIYINITKMAEFCKWKTTAQCYLGLGELIANKVIAPSTQPNLWFINPSIIFNGNRIVFITEYRKRSEKERKALGDPLKKEQIQSSISW
jgi:hypothetical protein